MSRIVKCDRCGKDITGKDRAYFSFHWKDETTDDLVGKNPWEGMDFCESCVREIRSVVERPSLSTTVLGEEPDAWR